MAVVTPCIDRGGGGGASSATLVVEDNRGSSAALSFREPDGVHLSRLPGPSGVREAMAGRAVYISQEAFINLILTRFNLIDATTFSRPLAPSAHLSAADCPTPQEEKTIRPYRE